MASGPIQLVADIGATHARFALAEPAAMVRLAEMVGTVLQIVLHPTLTPAGPILLAQTQMVAAAGKEAISFKPV